MYTRFSWNTYWLGHENNKIILYILLGNRSGNYVIHFSLFLGLTSNNHQFFFPHWLYWWHDDWKTQTVPLQFSGGTNHPRRNLMKSLSCSNSEDFNTQWWTAHIQTSGASTHIACLAPLICSTIRACINSIPNLLAGYQKIPHAYQHFTSLLKFEGQNNV